MSTNPATHPTDEDWSAFLAERDDWYAKGMPDDHPYTDRIKASQSTARPSFVAPLVVFR